MSSPGKPLNGGGNLDRANPTRAAVRRLPWIEARWLRFRSNSRARQASSYECARYFSCTPSRKATTFHACRYASRSASPGSAPSLAKASTAITEKARLVPAISSWLIGSASEDRPFLIRRLRVKECAHLVRWILRIPRPDGAMAPGDMTSTTKLAVSKSLSRIPEIMRSDAVRTEAPCAAAKHSGRAAYRSIARRSPGQRVKNRCALCNFASSAQGGRSVERPTKCANGPGNPRGTGSPLRHRILRNLVIVVSSGSERLCAQSSASGSPCVRAPSRSAFVHRSFKADVFLSCSARSLAFGSPAFPGRPDAEVIRQHCSRGFPRINYYAAVVVVVPSSQRVKTPSLRRQSGFRPSSGAPRPSTACGVGSRPSTTSGSARYTA